MRVSKKKIEAAIWKERFKQLRFIVASTILFLGIVSAIYIFHLASGEWHEVVVDVESIGLTQGYDGSSVYLVCKLDNGVLVTVFVENPSLIDVGSQVVLRVDEKFIKILGKKYTFLRINAL